MRYIMELEIPTDIGNDALRDPGFGAKMQAYLKDIKAEAAYFTSVNGQRGGYIILDIADASQIPAVAEPLFFWLGAAVDLKPVMKLEDLGAAGPAIAAAIEKWG